MYAFIRGTLQHIDTQEAIIEAGGIGYELAIPSTLMHDLPPIGEEVRLWTSFVLRENLQALYGFLRQSDKQLFEVLIAISGVGPKTALGIISFFSASELQDVVRNHDVRAMCKIPGIGKKTAERLIIDIRDKLPGLIQRELEDSSTQESAGHEPQLLGDAVSALVNLGFPRVQMHGIVKAILDNEKQPPELSDLIASALKKVQ